MKRFHLFPLFTIICTHVPPSLVLWEINKQYLIFYIFMVFQGNIKSNQSRLYQAMYVCKVVDPECIMHLFMDFPLSCKRHYSSVNWGCHLADQYHRIPPNWTLEIDLEHPHPLKTELKRGCRIVQFKAELPHQPAKRMPWTILHPFFSACPAKRLCFAGRWVGLNWTQWRMRQGSVPFRRKLRGFGFAPQGKWVSRVQGKNSRLLLRNRCLRKAALHPRLASKNRRLLQGWSPPAAEISSQQMEPAWWVSPQIFEVARRVDPSSAAPHRRGSCCVTWLIASFAVWECSGTTGDGCQYGCIALKTRPANS